MAQKPRFKNGPNSRGTQRREQKSGPEVAGPLGRRNTDVSAKHVHRPMGKVHDAHDAEDQSQSHREHREERCEG
ncbi:hypothetical protein D3C71_2056580 [compost metagenome]